MKLLLDAGPLIALFNEKDVYHTMSDAGFKQLYRDKAILVSPLPVMVEVYKWMLYNAHPKAAQSALNRMQQSINIIVINKAELDSLFSFVQSLNNWNGTLEDASVILFAQRYQCPIWTQNYRDFSSFKFLQFWNPN